VDTPYIIGVDIGGTKIAAGLVSAHQVLERVVLPTLADQNAGVVVAQVFKSIDHVLEKSGRKVEEISGIGIVAPGPLNPRTGELIYAPNIPSLINIPIATLVSERYHLPTLVENDANAAGLAEALFGAAVGFRYVFYVTVSTGIGTGVIIDGQIYSGKNGMGAEAGHVTIDYQGPLCSCGQRGCIEVFASGKAIVRRTREKLESQIGESNNRPVATSKILDLVSGNLHQITPAVVAEAARSGDLTAQEIIHETATYLSIWLGGMINIFDPEIIVIGGGVSSMGDLLFDVIRELTPKHSILPKAHEVIITPAKLRDDVGILGAATLFATMKEA